MFEFVVLVINPLRYLVHQLIQIRFLYILSKRRSVRHLWISHNQHLIEVVIRHIGMRDEHLCELHHVTQLLSLSLFYIVVAVHKIPHVLVCIEDHGRYMLGEEFEVFDIILESVSIVRVTERLSLSPAKVHIGLSDFHLPLFALFSVLVNKI